eukprot:5302074-Pyramimonas_sp.AAC.1
MASVGKLCAADRSSEASGARDSPTNCSRSRAGIRKPSSCSAKCSSHLSRQAVGVRAGVSSFKRT